MASLISLQKRYERSVKNEDYYSAEQACRMIHHRLTQQPNATPATRQQALDVLQRGAKTLLSVRQHQAGAALCLLIVKHYVDFEVPISEPAVSSLLALSSAFNTAIPASTSTEPPTNSLSPEASRERLRFLKAAIAWSSRTQLSGYPHGEPRLNTAAANVAADVGNYENAQRFFVRSDNPEGAAVALFKYASDQTLPSEVPLVLTRMILQYLVSENLADAHVFRRTFASLAAWPSVAEGASTQSLAAPPLAHFSELLITICQRQLTAAPLFKRVCDSYQPQLSRDPKLVSLLTKVGTIYFNIQPPQPSGMAGMMGTMLRGMMNT